MTIKLFAHILRHGSDEAWAGPWARDMRHWTLRDLVVRRPDLADWGVRETSGTWRAPPPQHAETGGPEPLWADTQPCWRE